MRRRPALVGLVAFLLGLGAARVLGAPARARVAIAVPHAPADLRCVDVADPTAFEDDCPETRGAAAECDARLASARRATEGRPTTHMPFPDVPEAEQAGPWTDTLAEALTACGIPATFEVADCDEYPCAAALRIPEGEEAKLDEAWRACPGLAGLEVGPVDVHCPDGSTEVAQVVMSTGDEVWTRAIQVNGKPPLDPTVATLLGLARRMESVAQMWECNVHGR